MRNVISAALAAAVVFVALTVCGCSHPETSPTSVTSRPADLNAAELPKGRFHWKALWTWLAPNTDAKRIQQTVELAKRCGFNVIIANTTGGGKACYNSRLIPTPDGRAIDPLAELVRQAHAQGIQVYAWICYLKLPGADYRKAHPDHYQVVTPQQEAKAKAQTRSHPDREDVQRGHWLCPDRGLTYFEKNVTDEIVKNYNIDGIAIDFLGYRNYADCHCDYSNAARREFAKKHPELSAEEAARQFSENSLIAFSHQAADAVHAAKPNLKIACHVYPDFDPNPLYANKMPVDYCGQTVAWFFKPHWSYETIWKKHKAFMNAERQGLKQNRHVPFIGCRGEELLKSPQRLQKEIRIAGTEGCDRLMFAFNFTLDKHPELVQVLHDELCEPAESRSP